VILARRLHGAALRPPPAPAPPPDPRDAEIAALRARVGELEALLASATEPAAPAAPRPRR